MRQGPYHPLMRNTGVIREPIELTPIYYQELLKQWPTTVGEKIDRTLCNLGRLSSKGGDVIDVTAQGLQCVFAEDNNEEVFLLDSLEQIGLIDRSRSHLTAKRASLTAMGWQRFEELRRTNRPENSVFVAMWYGIEKSADGSENRDREPEMNELYQQIEEAVKATGYKATRADLNQHNNFIMDQVIADMKEAPFVISDLTGHRNGVYFEAGFARGLNLEVIHTCKDTDFDKAHFDVKQINTIKWAAPADIVKPLMDRIRATVGRGPHNPDDYRESAATTL